MLIALRPRLGRATGAIAVAISLACGSETTQPPPPPAVVASVVIADAPTTPILDGASVTLTAGAVDAGGKSIPGASVVWKSSDESIATVSTAGVVKGIGLGSVTITATSGTIVGSAQLTVRAGTSMTTDGGVVSALNGAVQLTVPPGALAQAEMMFVSAPPTGLPANARLVPGTAFTIGNEPSAPFGESRLAVTYDLTKLPAGVTEGSLQLYVLDASGWSVVRRSGAQVSTHIVSGQISQSGTYAIVGTAVDHVTVTGNETFLALLAGKTRVLSVTAFDAANIVLDGRTVTWQTSDAARATVSPTGVVTGVGAGTVTITATVEGKSASTTIALVGPVTADWSQAGEWTTFQGTGAHTGYMPVVIDPAVLVHRETDFPGFTTTDLSYAVSFTGMAIYTANGSSGHNANALSVSLPNVPAGSYFASTLLGDGATITAPSAANGSVYVQTTMGTQSRFWILDGHGLPRTFVDYSSKAVSYPGPVATTQAVFVACGDPVGVCALDPSTGGRKWFKQTNPSDQWSPAVANDVVYTYTGLPSPKLQAFAAATGQALYEIPDSHFVGTSPSMNVAPAIGANADILVTQGGRLVSFNSAAQGIAFEIPGAFAGNVTIANGVLYVRNNGKVDARREGDGSLLWTWTPPEGAATNSLIATKNLLFVSTSKNTYAVDLASQADGVRLAGGWSAVDRGGRSVAHFEHREHHVDRGEVGRSAANGLAQLNRRLAACTNRLRCSAVCVAMTDARNSLPVALGGDIIARPTTSIRPMQQAMPHDLAL